MPRRSSSYQPSTALGAELIQRRGKRTQAEVSKEAGITQMTWSTAERGTVRPSYETAKALATWLGWSLERVLEAAETPAEKEKIEES